MRYQRVRWHHDRDDEPVVLYSEIDDEGAELRKVDEYRDGRLDYADKPRATGSTWLSLEHMPPIAAIDAQPEFTAESIDRPAFEAIWRRATRDV